VIKEMRKAILILAGLLLVFSGVAAVSAYEAHIINVKAQVENALTVSGGEGDEWDLGTIFPQEFFTAHYTVSLSSSFLEQKWEPDGVTPGRVNSVNITFYAEEKLESDGGTPDDPTDDTYYAWMGEFVKLGTALSDTHTDVQTKGGTPANTPDGKINFADDGWELVGPKPGGGPPAVQAVLTDRILGIQPGGLDQIDSFELWIGVDAPVFLPHYNYDTDVCPKPNGLDEPTYQMPSDDPRNNNGAGDVFGLDIKIQVTDIFQTPIP
jgi:hypothetical protein